jgi:hypothetical protein
MTVGVGPTCWASDAQDDQAWMGLPCRAKPLRILSCSRMMHDWGCSTSRVCVPPVGPELPSWIDAHGGQACFDPLKPMEL